MPALSPALCTLANSLGRWHAPPGAIQVATVGHHGVVCADPACTNWRPPGLGSVGVEGAAVAPPTALSTWLRHRGAPELEDPWLDKGLDSCRLATRKSTPAWSLPRTDAYRRLDRGAWLHVAQVGLASATARGNGSGDTESLGPSAWMIAQCPASDAVFVLPTGRWGMDAPLRDSGGGGGGGASVSNSDGAPALDPNPLHWHRLGWPALRFDFSRTAASSAGPQSSMSLEACTTEMNAGQAVLNAVEAAGVARARAVFKGKHLLIVGDSVRNT